MGRIGTIGDQDVRASQSRSATSRAFTAQHWGVLGIRPGQRTARLMAGTAMVEAPNRAVTMMVEKCIVDNLRGCYLGM